MKSSILAALLSICLFTTHLTALVTRAATLDRKCPLESDCMENICTNFSFIEKEEKDPFYLVAQCKNKKGNYVYTKLDLKKCIANWDGNLEWTPRYDSLQGQDVFQRRVLDGHVVVDETLADNSTLNRGGFRCSECGVFQKSADTYVGLKCEECKPRIFWLEGYKSPSINLCGYSIARLFQSLPC